MMMYSPARHAASNTMTNKKNKNSALVKMQKELAALKLAKAKKSKKKSTPFKDVGGTIGAAAGRMFGVPQLAGVGKWLGSGIGSIFGSGDYNMVGPTPEYNILQGQIPKFSSTHATNIVCHREYLGDIIGLAGFQNLQYPLNPGMDQTFPWLSGIAANYQQYRFHGLVFEFRSLITDYVTSGAPGVLVMTTNYNADQPAFVTRQEAENAEFAVATKPTANLVHMIECKPDETANKLYNIRTTSVPTGQDLRLYDYGLTQLITQNNPAQNLGELWVSYCVEFFKPVLAQENNYVAAASFHAARTGATSANPFGLIGFASSGTLATTITGSSVTIYNAQVGEAYLFSLSWSGATTVSITSSSTTNCTAVNLFQLDTATAVGAGVGTTAQCSVYCYTPTVSGNMTLTITGATITGTPNVDITISQIDQSTRV